MGDFQAYVGASTEVETVFWAISFIVSFLFLIKILVELLGIDLDFDIGGDFFNLDTILPSLFVFSWTGVLASRMTDFNSPLIIISALISGIITFFLAFFLFKKVRSFESNGNMKLENAIGKVGKVYLTIPSDGIEKGQVEVLVQGRLSIFYAISKTNKGFVTGEKVLIYDIMEGVLVVDTYS